MQTYKPHQNPTRALALSGHSSLVEIAKKSFDEFWMSCRDTLRFSEIRALYLAAQQHVKQLHAYRRKIFTHANPQLQNALKLAVKPLLTAERDYENIFGQRADGYVPKHSVASMFSPAAYLTELYREGRQLHPSENLRHLDQRRPYLKNLALDQGNMDADISTLALSNSVLKSVIKHPNGWSDEQLGFHLAEQAYPFDLPHHIPFAGIEAALNTQHADFSTLAQSLVSEAVTHDTRAAFANHVSPGLYQLLLAPVPDDEAEQKAVLQRHFGTTDLNQLSDAAFFCQRVGISRDELNEYLGLPVFEQAAGSVKGAFTTGPVSSDKYAGKYLRLSQCAFAQSEGSFSGQIVQIDLDGKLKSGKFQSSIPFNNPSQIAHFSLCPSTSAGKVILSVRSANPDKDGQLDIKIDGKTVFHQDKSSPIYGHYFNIVTDIKNSFEFRVIRIRNGSSFQSAATVKFEPAMTLVAADFIRLSKLIRYHQKTGLSPAALDTLIGLSQADPAALDINLKTLQLSARVLSYQQRYSISLDEAMVLAGADINVYAPAGEMSQFDRLFNAPPLNGIPFTTDDADDSLSFDAADTVYAHHRAVLKRALGVEDAGLAALAAIVDQDDSQWARSLANLSMLYRVGLLARLHQLTPQALQRLLRLNGKTQDLLPLNQPCGDFSDYLDAVHTSAQWLAAETLTVSMLDAMTTRQYPLTLTPEIEHFLQTLYHAGLGAEAAKRKDALAPHIAAGLGLNERETARLLEDWIDLIAAEQELALTSMDSFWQEIVNVYGEEKEGRDADIGNLAAFCQALGQLTLIVKGWQLSPAELDALLNQPTILPVEQGKLSLTLSHLQRLSHFKTLQRASGERANELLTALKDNMLNVPLLAQLLDASETELAQAAVAMGLASGAVLNVAQAYTMSTWLHSAQALGVSVQTVDALLKQRLQAAFADWQRLAGELLAGVSVSAAQAMNGQLDEALSQALCACWLQSDQANQLRGQNIPLQNRDDVFQYLLLDNQVSAEIHTTPIAEAISSVQLYINRCLQGLEAGVDRKQLLETFFVEWDAYNKRYSTWAGVSQLAYYPENYLDPSLRYNQSPLQRQLLTEISQSQLSTESVEAAYHNYLNGFEDIANLNILSGYHHAAEMDTGKSYYLGRSNAQPYRYFWRSLDHEGSDGEGGFVASAWSSWEEIDAPINPVFDQARPVIFNNRLYIGWVEKQSRPQVDAGGEVVGHVDDYLFKLSYRKINGSWSPAMGFALDMKQGKTPAMPKVFNLYLSYHPLQNALLAMLYSPEFDSGSQYDPQDDFGWWTGGFIDGRMRYAVVDVKDGVDVFGLFYKNLNGPSAPNKLIRYINAVNYTANSDQGSTLDKLPSEWITVSDVAINALEVDNLKVPAHLSYSADADIVTTNKSTLPTVVSQPGSLEDNSGQGFNVTAATVNSSINGNTCTHAADISITTKTTGYIYKYVNVSFLEAHHGISGKCYLSDDEYSLRVNLSLIINNDKFPDGEYYLGFSDSVFEIGEEKKVQIKNGSLHDFFETINPDGNESKLSFYLRLNKESQGNESLGGIVVEGYSCTPSAKSLTIAFGEQTTTIPQGPADNHLINTLRVTQAIDNPAGFTAPKEICVTERGGAAWKRTDTLGYSTYTEGKTFTYDWGSNPKILPASGTTSVRQLCTNNISGDGLKETRTLTIKEGNNVVFSQPFVITVNKSESASPNPSEYYQIVQSENQAQYLATNTANRRRIRLNTLFADKLINLANSGLDNVLSWETQQLPEPPLGEGVYFEFTTTPYDASPDQGHGPSRNFMLLSDAKYNNENYYFYIGSVGDTAKTHRCFLPKGSEGKYLHVKYSFDADEAFDPGNSIPLSMIFSGEDFSGHSQGMRFASSQVSDAPTEPMDFSGANGLYFWELFYYTPMLVADKLLHTQNFAEAERWLQYVFNPAGYLEGQAPTQHHVDRQWNTRPLAEDTSWDDTQTDSTDPDIVAQGDPMHYKVFTYMKLLDLLIARGDMAYRKLEPDTLAEAKMWYVTALNLLGQEPDLPLSRAWCNPTLGAAADETAEQQLLLGMERVLAGATVPHASQEPRSANSLTALFQPTENDKLKGYWQTLKQRLFNLRHQLSLDGQPLTLPVYASPADPKALQSAAALAGAVGGAPLPDARIAIQRFPLMLESARSLVGQLVQFGGTLASVLERKDGEALNTLLQTQAQDLMQRSIEMQGKTLAQLQAEHQTLATSLEGARARHGHYQRLLDEGTSLAEQQSIDERVASGQLVTAANALRTAGAALDLAPNVFGLANGGMQWGGVTSAIALGMDAHANALATSAEARATSEQYRRRAQEWTIQRDAAEHEIKQIQAQQASLAIQTEAAQLQMGYLETQQAHTQAQLDFLKTKFSNEALYSWMQGRLSAVFYQFYDRAIARCLQAQLGYQWETQATATFIQPGAWDGNHAGLLCGEALMLNLAQMEAAYLAWDGRALEVNRTVSMALELAGALRDSSFNAEVKKVLGNESSSMTPHTLTMTNGVLVASIDLNALNIAEDYPDSVLLNKDVRRIKQLSVSLPALLGPYQDIQAVLGYSSNGGGIHQSCMQTAISHGLNDSGQFQLDFNDSKYLPFEGLPINGGGSAKLTLSFPNVGLEGKQRAVLESLNDIILHIRYTIRAAS
ncbi:hypothetical protein BUE93_20555 [Chromobacterium amazonense]|uniref:Toxin n=1 Tax=Chromobacterium amazonense TaxID=1382803 RepID=A0A2S9WZ65_9NEIS|nr:neuraminidase-like domain-containing protein [Chromobacterium amazonense]PRP68767.1 hypothetical protein BUE93_20555 [Chromobacterium amazonense]